MTRSRTVWFLTILLAFTATRQDDSRYKLFTVHELNSTDNQANFFGGNTSDHFFTHSLRPGHQVINLQETFNMRPGVAAEHPVASAYVYLSCSYQDNQPCEFELDIKDSLLWNGVLYKKTQNQFILRVDYFEYYKYYFVMRNPNDKEIFVFSSFNCEKCGRANHKVKKLFSTDKLEKKYQMIEQIKSNLNQMSILTARTKATVFQFSKNLTKSESYLLNFAIIETAAVILVGIWQIWHIKRIIRRRNLF